MRLGGKLAQAVHGRMHHAGDRQRAVGDDQHVEINQAVALALVVVGDPGARLDLWRYLHRLQQEAGVTVLVTTHLMEEAERCDRLGILDSGRLVALGTPAELRSSIGGDCLTPACSNGNKTQNPIPVPANCSLGGTVCTAAGACVACNVLEDCGNAGTCKLYTCQSNN